jgi:hypothetical protein
VEKLQVRVLPCVVMFVGGVAVDRIVGFEPLGATDDFPTSQVPLAAWCLLTAAMLPAACCTDCSCCGFCRACCLLCLPKPCLLLRHRHSLLNCLWCLY